MKTKPIHWLDYFLWPVLRVFWVPFSKKRSHFWHWVDVNYYPKFYITANPDPAAKSRRHSLWENLIQTNFKWNKVVVVTPVRYSGQYRIGMIAEGKRQICSVINQGKVGLLIGPEAPHFFALNLKGDQIMLKIVGYSTKKSLPKGIKII
ncbi:MAG: hypothetical protein NUV82_01045 [Candidatus Komeilibacteria bacterium]|nr:hypothetical protein [Candidatus Komeilibacteria bacterium]